MIEVCIPGEPVPQGRPRFVRRGRFHVALDPERSRKWKAHAKKYIEAAVYPAGPLEGPLELDVLFVFASPASHHPKATKANPTPAPLPRRWRGSRPDADNLVKAAMDASNGILFKDDCQVVSITARKVWGAQGEAPGVYLTVRPVEVAP